MLRKHGQRWTLFCCSTLLPVVAATWAIYLKVAGTDLWRWQTLIIPFGILALSGTTAYRSTIKPLRDFEPITKDFLDHLGKSIIDLGKRDGINPRLNILLIYRPWYCPFKKQLRLVWGLKMNNQPDVNIRFPISKGIAGEVCRRKTQILVDLESANQTDWRFSEEEIKKYNFRQIKAIYSFPVYEIDRKNSQTGKVIGTINLDARKLGSFTKMQVRQDRYTEYLELFSEFVSKICS